jgi:tripartite-type tricarboxylate transporter receptor subunit TctC
VWKPSGSSPAAKEIVVANRHSEGLLQAGRRAILSVTLLALSNHFACCETARPIKIVVPYTAGSPSDLVARLLADEISRAQSTTIFIENRPGASTAIGTEAVARAAPDGSTLLIATTAFLINAHLRKLSYDPLNSFEPICSLTSSPTVVVVSSASPYQSLTDLFNAARANPAILTVAGVGPASTVHIGIEELKRAAKVDLTFIPYPGPPPAVSALLGGHVTAIFVPYSAVEAHLKAGKLRALAISSRTRIELLPKVPTLAESGYEDFAMDVWFGVVAPANTPKRTVSKLAEWFMAALHAPDIRATLAIQGLYPSGICGAGFAAFLRNRFDEYGRALRQANITVE